MSEKTKAKKERRGQQPWRRHLVFFVALLVFSLLAARVVHLQTVERERLRAQGDARYLRELSVAPARGRILDRHRRVLAMSTPVSTLWAEPRQFCASEKVWRPLLQVRETGVTAQQLRARCAARKNHDFMYVARRLPPNVAENALTHGIAGMASKREYKRYYPNAAAGAHLIGFTDVDERGQEGLESVYQRQLAGRPGRMRGYKDRAGNYVESVENIRQVRHGKDLRISIDQRIQSMAADYLEAAVRENRARGGSVVAVAVPSGEIIGMVNSPQFNPNNRKTLAAHAYRNRSVTDLIEPGSVVKPFAVGMALESGEIGVDTLINTSPGTLQLGRRVIEDVRDFGEIAVGDVIKYSSNVGMVKLALRFSYENLFAALQSAGFGRRAGVLPGESAGSLQRRARRVDHAALSYGYGLSATPLQIARAYTVFATDGEMLELTLTPQPRNHRAAAQRVFSAKTARAVREMLGSVVTAGTARKAAIPRYRVGGKTGTTRKLIDGAYADDRYVSIFAGMAPLDSPRFVVVVSIDDPRGQFYYGGDVAVPVFTRLMRDLLRLYNIKPDAVAAL